MGKANPRHLGQNGLPGLDGEPTHSGGIARRRPHVSGWRGLDPEGIRIQGFPTGGSLERGAFDGGRISRRGRDLAGWSELDEGSLGTDTLYGLTWAATRWVGVGYKGAVQTSPDG
jgi:hypothetical protein